MIILLILVVALFVFYRDYQQSSISPHLGELLAGKHILLDVRTEWEFNQGHLEGAINMSLRKLRKDCGKLNKAMVYITYCSHGLRSIKALSILKNCGYKKIHNGGPLSDLRDHLAQ